MRPDSSSGQPCRFHCSSAFSQGRRRSWLTLQAHRRPLSNVGPQGADMDARQLIGAAAFPPDVLKVLFDAFDDAWAEVAPDVSGDPTVVDAARLSLAGIVLSVATAGPIDRDAIKAAAVN